MAHLVIDNGQLTQEKARVFLNSTELPGVQSLNGNYNLNSNPVKYLGMSETTTIPNSPYNGSLNLSCLLLSDDRLIEHTGYNAFNCYVTQERKSISENFSYSLAYLTKYRSRCSINQIPQIEADIIVLGDVGTSTGQGAGFSGFSGFSGVDKITGDFSTISGEWDTLLLKIPTAGSISLDVDDFVTNRVQSYSLSIDVPRRPLYVLNKSTPHQVDINYPMVVDMSFNIALNDYTSSGLSSYPFNHKTKNITLSIYEESNGNLIKSYGFSGLDLYGEGYVATVGNAINMNLHYKGYLD